MKNWMLHKAFGIFLSFVLMLQSCDGVDSTDTIWRVITTTTQDPARQANVQKILSLGPQRIHVMVGNNGFDLDCVLYLNENGIRVSKSYHNGESSTIHSGKLGHWCTFLRFLDIVEESGKTGVWIEDDVLLELKDIDNIMQVILGDHTKPQVRMSGGDGVLVIKNASEMLRIVKNLEITDPADVFYSVHGMVEKVSIKSLINKMKNVKSGITTTTQYPIDLVNKMIQMRTAPG
jgi:hypothetical protein